MEKLVLHLDDLYRDYIVDLYPGESSISLESFLSWRHTLTRMTSEWELLEHGLMGEFPYAIVKDGYGRWLCGYVGVPMTHPLAELDLSALSVPLGVDPAYAKGDPDYPVALPVPVWWFGWDSYHAYQLMNNKVLDVDFMRLQCEGLAKSLAEYSSDA